MKTQLQKLRKEAGYKTQEEFAEAFGVPYRRYASWERGEVDMSLFTAYQLTEFIGCTLEELVGRPAPIPQYNDQRQNALNACYENMNDDGKQTLVKVARSLEFDITNRMEKKEPEDNPNLEQLAG